MRRYAILALAVYATAIVACAGRPGAAPGAPDLPTTGARSSTVKISFSVPPGTGQRRSTGATRNMPAAHRLAPAAHRVAPQFIDYANTTTIAVAVSQAPGSPPLAGFTEQQAQLAISCPSTNVTPCVISTTFQLPSAVPLLFAVTAFDSGGNQTGGTATTTTLGPGVQTLTLTLGGAVTTFVLTVTPVTGVAGTPQTISLTAGAATDPDGLTFSGSFATPVPVTGFLDGGYLPPFATATTAPITYNGQPYMNVTSAAFANSGSTASISYTGLFDGQDAILDVFNQSDPVAYFSASCPAGTPMCASLVMPTFANGVDLPGAPVSGTNALANYHGKVYLTDGNSSIVVFDPMTGNQTRLTSGSGAAVEPAAGVTALFAVGNALEYVDANGFGQFDDATQTFTVEAPVPGTCTAPFGGGNLVMGQDGSIWYSGGSALEAFNPASTACNAYQLQSGTSIAQGQAVATAGNSIWFLNLNYSTGTSPALGRIPINAAPNSTVNDAELPIPGGDTPQAIAKGPDGNIWITDSQAASIYKVDAHTGSSTYGTIVNTYTLTSPAIVMPNLSVLQTDSVNASDAAYLYFSDQGDDVLGRFDPSSGNFTYFTPKFTGPSVSPGSGPQSAIAFDGVRNVYVTFLAAGIDGSGNTVGVANVSLVTSTAARRGLRLPATRATQRRPPSAAARR